MMYNNPGGVAVANPGLENLVSKAQSLPGVAESIGNAHAPGYEISAMISNTDFCLKGGFLKVVTFYKVRKRRQSSFPRLSTTIVAEVLFNSDEEVIATECFT